MKREKILKEIRSWIIIIGLALFLSALINSQFFAMATVKEVSMQDTLIAEQRLVVNRLSYIKKSPQNGDIIVFYMNREIGSRLQEFFRSIGNIFSVFGRKEESRDRLVKRVIAVPGDVIDIIDGYVYVNNERLDEPYIKGITEPGSFKLPVTVGEDQLFVMGDNRESSMDSRDFGLIDFSHVEGKAVLRIYPFNKFGKIN
ncbi:MAG: signal peptidase I [Clostridiales bacterium]|nr:signal peptidase I [Clostridiales bacterium]